MRWTAYYTIYYTDVFNGDWYNSDKGSAILSLIAMHFQTQNAYVRFYES